MPDNNNVATVLLLIALGVIIWYLTNSNSCDEVDNEVNNVVVKKNSEKEAFGNQHYQPYEIEGPNLQVSEKDRMMLAGPTNNMASLMNPAIDRSTNSELKGVFQFAGHNSEAANYAGLDDAFIPPLPSGVNPDVVDINKNNVTNYNAKDFLPKEINSEWFDTDFSQAKHTLNDDKLINTERYVIGINTVGESLKNASYDIRGTVPNPKFTVSPWNNSTYEPDYNIKPLC
jgi:hypothetical protein